MFRVSISIRNEISIIFLFQPMQWSFCLSSVSSTDHDIGFRRDLQMCVLSWKWFWVNVRKTILIEIGAGGCWTTAASFCAICIATESFINQKCVSTRFHYQYRKNHRRGKRTMRVVHSAYTAFFPVSNLIHTHLMRTHEQFFFIMKSFKWKREDSLTTDCVCKSEKDQHQGDIECLNGFRSTQYTQLNWIWFFLIRSRLVFLFAFAISSRNCVYLIKVIAFC